MNTVIAPVDFSPASRRVVDTAVRLAQAMQGRVLVLHVVRMPGIVDDMTSLGGGVLELADAMEQAGRRHLHQIQRRLLRKGVLVETMCVSGSPVPCIVEYAKRQEARYIVIGTSGHGRWRDLAMGGTTRGVLRRAKCPVVVVPAVVARARRTGRPTAAGRKKSRRGQ